MTTSIVQGCVGVPEAIQMLSQDSRSDEEAGYDAAVQQQHFPRPRMMAGGASAYYKLLGVDKPKSQYWK